MQRIETFLRMNDGTELFTRKFMRPSSRGTVVFVHGACEHSGRYHHIFESLFDRGWNVVAYDQRGHGRSSGLDTHITTFEDYSHDLLDVCDQLGLPSESTVLMGHSMGGLVVIRAAQTHLGRFAGTVLTSPLLGVKVRIPYRTLIAGRVLSWYAPETRFRSRIRAADNCRDQAVLEARKNDPLIRRSVTAGWYFAVRRAVRSAWKERNQIFAPMLILQSGADAVVCPRATTRWARKVDDATLFVVPEAYHDLLNEPCRDEVVNRVIDWLDEGPISSPFVDSAPKAQQTLGLIAPLRKAS